MEVVSENLTEERSAELTLEQAELRFQETMVLLGWAENYLRDSLKSGKLPDTKEIRTAVSDLGQAIKVTQTERERVATIRRKNGELVGGDLDLGSARDQVCKQLDCIARSLQEG